MRKPLLTVFLSLIFLLVIQGHSFCQRFAGNPPSLKWKQVNTDTARIIFPAGLDSQALRVSSLVHYMASHASASSGLSLGNKLHKINIVLQNQTTIANGYVGLGPYRSEFFLTPAINNFDEGTIPWNDQLAIHEYRHVQQFNNFRTGLSNVMYVLFGQEGYSLAINASVPDWFYEGDAVYNETILSKQGRGRIPLFLNEYPSLWQAGKNYSWMKLRNGSLKDFVPDHYHLGYLLVNYGREKYGLDFWSKVTRDAAAFKGLFYPFQQAIKRHAGVDYKTFCNDAFAYYKKLSSDMQLRSEIPNRVSGQAPGTMTQGTEAGIRNIIPVNKRVLTSYLFPYSISPDSLLYLKAGNDKRPAFYIRDSKGEHMLRVKDISADQQFSYRNGKIVYAAYENDPRWGWRDYSVIKLLDIHNNTQTTLQHKTKYFTPDISPSGEKIAAVHIAENGKSELHILDANSGEVAHTIKSADITLFTDPKFIDDATLVCVVRLLDGKTALAIADIASGSIERLTTPSYNVVGYPCVNNGMVYFTASYGGNDDVFVLRLSDKKISRLTHSSLGNYFVNAANGKITWSAFTAEGYQLQQLEEKDMQLVPVTDVVVEQATEKFPVSHAAEVPDVLLNPAVNRNFPVKDYSKVTGLFNFHSWRPYYEDPVFTFSLYGENVLNTLQTEIYYLYNQNDRTNAAGISAVYGQWFPYLSIGSQMTFALQDSTKRWNQLDTRIGFNIPLDFTRGRTFNSFNIGTNYYLTNQLLTGPTKNNFSPFNYTSVQNYISWGQQVQRAKQHIYPRLGYAINLNHRIALTTIDGYQFFASGTVYLPGALPTHSLVLTGAFQQRDIYRALFASRIADARGYSDYYRTNVGSRMWRLSGNYHLPLLIPDCGVANILYLQRFRGNVFYDIQRLYSNNKQSTFDLRSFGGELYVDTKWWNQYELTFGIRVSHLLDNDPRAGLAKGSNVFEFILPVSIIPR